MVVVVMMFALSARLKVGLFYSQLNLWDVIFFLLGNLPAVIPELFSFPKNQLLSKQTPPCSPMPTQTSPTAPA